MILKTRGIKLTSLFAWFCYNHRHVQCNPVTVSVYQWNSKEEFENYEFKLFLNFTCDTPPHPKWSKEIKLYINVKFQYVKQRCPFYNGHVDVIFIIHVFLPQYLNPLDIVFFFSLAPLTFEILRSDCSNSEKKISYTLDIFTVRRHGCKFLYLDQVRNMYNTSIRK